jgi:hypothetical protein
MHRFDLSNKILSCNIMFKTLHINHMKFTFDVSLKSNSFGVVHFLYHQWSLPLGHFVSCRKLQMRVEK